MQLPSGVRFEDTPGGTRRATICSSEAEASIYFQGAHVTEWVPKSHKPVLFVSRKSLFVPGKPIRGGVPVIWPWFGPRGGGLPGPAHGFARTSDWTLESVQQNNGTITLHFVFVPNEAARSFGFPAFRLDYRVSIGSTLELALETHNRSGEPLTYEEALHSYFAIGDIESISISGLEGTTYVDKTDNLRRKQQDDQTIRIAKETDQVHLNTGAACVIHDHAWDRRIIVEKSGSASTVVWNPWIEKTKTLSDMALDDWRKMVCMESANALDNAVTLAPGASHKLITSIRVE